MARVALPLFLLHWTRGSDDLDALSSTLLLQTKLTSQRAAVNTSLEDTALAARNARMHATALTAMRSRALFWSADSETALECRMFYGDDVDVARCSKCGAGCLDEISTEAWGDAEVAMTQLLTCSDSCVALENKVANKCTESFGALADLPSCVMCAVECGCSDPNCDVTCIGKCLAADANTELVATQPLAERDVWPLCSDSDTPEVHCRSRFAVVRPLNAGELDDLRNSINHSHRSGCEERSPVDLVLYHYGSGWSQAAKQLESIAEGMAEQDCFARVRVIHARYPWYLKYPDAPCLQFTHIFAGAHPAWGYEAIYQMELDVAPLRRNWLQGLMAYFEEAASGQSWVIGAGSEWRCLNNPDGELVAKEAVHEKNLAINGNAIYSTDPVFVQLVNDYTPLCQAPQLHLHVPHDRSGDTEMGGFYDTGLYYVDDHFLKWPGKWKWVPEVLNCKYPPYKTQDPASISRRFPEALVAHMDSVALQQLLLAH